MPKQRILVVDDEPDIRDVLRLTLEAEGYLVFEATDGQEAVQQAQKVRPDLMLLDFKMPRMDGPHVCMALKRDTLLQHLPIIMLTSKGEISDKVEGINAGADDYLTKPFEPTELLARVGMILRRTARALDANPLTRLPGNASILEELQTRLDLQQPLAVCYVDLDQFKAFNDRYGFEKGDEVIKATAGVLLNAMRSYGTPEDFLGHIGGDDFVLITQPSAAQRVSDQILSDLVKLAPNFYNQEERRKGYIEAKDRDGQMKKFALLTASIAIVTNQQRALKHVAEVAQIGAELKSWAKQKGGNRWVKDRRGEST